MGPDGGRMRGMRGPRFSSGLVNQQAWKKLKGGTQQLNADLSAITIRGERLPPAVLAATGVEAPPKD